jgi:hypothetical protein
VEKQAAGVGQDGGAAWGDAILGEETDNVVEQVVDLLDGVESVGLFAEKGGRKIGDFAASSLSLACWKQRPKPESMTESLQRLPLAKRKQQRVSVLSSVVVWRTRSVGFGLVQGRRRWFVSFWSSFVRGDGNTRLKNRSGYPYPGVFCMNVKGKGLPEKDVGSC